MTSKQTNSDGSDITAQELIRSTSVHLKFGKLRKQKSKLPLTKWPSRFVVVVDGRVYIFEDDQSPRPKSVLSLLEFNKVEEDKSKNYKWCFSLIGSYSSNQETARVKTFACSCESEREQWKLAIGFQIYIVEHSHKAPSDYEGFDPVIRYYRDDNEYSDFTTVHRRRNTVAMDERKNKVREGAIPPRYNRTQSMMPTLNRPGEQSSSNETESDIAADFAQHKITEYSTLDRTSKDRESSHVYHKIKMYQKSPTTASTSPKNFYTALPKTKREFKSELKSATSLPTNYLQYVPPKPPKQKVETEAPPIPPRRRISTADLEQNVYDEYNSQNFLESITSKDRESSQVYHEIKIIQESSATASTSPKSFRTTLPKATGANLAKHDFVSELKSATSLPTNHLQHVPSRPPKQNVETEAPPIPPRCLIKTADLEEQNVYDEYNSQNFLESITSKDRESSYIHQEITFNQKNSATASTSSKSLQTTLPNATGANLAKQEFISELKSATSLPKNYLQHEPLRPPKQKVDTEAPPIPPRRCISTAELEEQNVYDEYNSQNFLESITSKDRESSYIHQEITFNQKISATASTSPKSLQTTLPNATGANLAKQEFISELRSVTSLPINYLQHEPQTPRPPKQKLKTVALPISPRCGISTADLDEQNVSDEYNAQNFLELMCSMTDNRYDQQKLVSLLQDTQQSGTYLIRKSRQGWKKVLSYLSQNGQVLEYKIFNFRGQFTLDKESYFDTLSSMLEHYSTIEPIPNTRDYLKLGIHQIVDKLKI